MDLITTHRHADFDGFASMIAARKLYPEALLVFSGGTQEHVRRFLAAHELGITKQKAVDLSAITRLILVDVHEPERIGPFRVLFDNPAVEIHIYDHHPVPPQILEHSPRERPISIVTHEVGASITIFVELLQARAFSLTPFEATVFAIGLYEETGSLCYPSTTPRDLEAAAFLLRAGADLTVVSDTLHPHLNPDQISLLNDLLLSSETLYLNGHKILLATSTYDRYTGDLSEVTQRLAELEGYDAVITAMTLQDKIQIIARSRRPDIHVGRLVSQFGGGGHAQAASATVKGQTLVEVKERLRHLLLHAHRPILRASQVMTTPVHTIPIGTPIEKAEQEMTKLGINVFPVVDTDHHFQGLITREIIQKALFHQLTDTPVESVMHVEVYTASPDTPFHEIQAQMIDRNQRLVPILTDHHVVGVITRTDLLRTLHYDILEAAHAPAKGSQPPHVKKSRRLRALLKERLPTRVYALLTAIGERADQQSLNVYAVGGFVRDLLLGISNLDIDLVVEGDGIAFARLVAQDHQARIRTHDRFGTATLVFPDGFKLDIATARTEYYEYPTALPTVEQSSIKKDLYRRDFTINTLAIRLNAACFGELVDFYGGQRDLHDKVIRVLHSLSFVEDPTRVFRAIRFEQRLGFHLGKETAALIKGAVRMNLFHRLSKSRLLDELILLLSDKEPVKGLARLAEFRLLTFIHPDLTWSTQLAALLNAVREALNWYTLLYLDRGVDAWIVYFMALMDPLSRQAVEETVHRLGLAPRQAHKVLWAHDVAPGLIQQLSRHPTPKPSETFHLLREVPDEILVFLIAKTPTESVKRQISAFLTHYMHVKPILTGKDLQAMGLTPGPLFKQIFDHLVDARLDGLVRTEEQERKLVMQFVESKREAVPH
ncbi:MAG: CBS domain-containing protein [Nitrospirae bacterium]|nr:MAG: CBS domain-containing protein [Nitrospirota bacterium]